MRDEISVNRELSELEHEYGKILLRQPCLCLAQSLVSHPAEVRGVYAGDLRASGAASTWAVLAELQSLCINVSYNAGPRASLGAAYLYMLWDEGLCYVHGRVGLLSAPNSCPLLPKFAQRRQQQTRLLTTTSRSVDTSPTSGWSCTSGTRTAAAAVAAARGPSEELAGTAGDDHSRGGLKRGSRKGETSGLVEARRATVRAELTSFSTNLGRGIARIRTRRAVFEGLWGGGDESISLVWCRLVDDLD